MESVEDALNVVIATQGSLCFDEFVNLRLKDLWFSIIALIITK